LGAKQLLIHDHINLDRGSASLVLAHELSTIAIRLEQLANSRVTASREKTSLIEHAENRAKVATPGQVASRLYRERKQETYGSFAKSLLQERRDRIEVLDENLLGDPAWDMLLDLIVADEFSTRIAVSSLCLAACVPATTALRWIGNLVERNILERCDDDEDKRRVYLKLTPKTRAALLGYLRKVAERRGVELFEAVKKRAT
jgi:DNA-binding MarR family transcriptional regulator